MIIKINAPVGFHEIGTRAKQEDAIFPQLSALTSESQVIVLCDGLSGNDYGDIASNTVANAIGNWIESNVDENTPLSQAMAMDAVEHAQQRLNAAAASYRSSEPMGTTMAMLVMGENGAVAAHIGNLRIYHIRPATGTILYRSRDHSLVNDLFVMGRLTRIETEASPKKNILTRAMMSAPAPAAQPDVALITDIKAGDYFMLCSDGVASEVNDKQLLKTLQRDNMTDAMKLAHIQMLAKGGGDNRTAVLIKVDNVIHEVGERLLVANEAAMCDKMVHMSSTTAAAAVASETARAASDSAAAPDEPHAETAIPPEIPDEAAAIVPEIPDEAVAAPEIADEAPDATLPETEYSTGDEDIPHENSKPTKKKNSGLLLAAGILLAGLLLAGGIMAYFMNKKPTVETSTVKPATDTLRDPDVSIDSMLPPMPGDSLQVGTDVAVPPAPRMSDVPLPDASGSTAKAPRGSYQTGSGVAVPRAPRYSGNNTPPYDPYEGTENFGSDEPIHDEPATAPAPATGADRATTPAREPATSAVPAAPSSAKGTPPPPRPKASNDPARSNRNVPVPMPSGRSNRPIETP